MKFSKNEIKAFIKGYYVDNNGNVYGPSGCMIGITTNKRGYKYLTMKENGKSYYLSIHRFIALFKFGSRIYNEKLEIRHLDGNPSNNYFNNIEIGTHSDNMMDIPQQVRFNIGRNNPIKYQQDLVLKIRKYYNNCKSYKKTMLEFNISSPGTLRYILYFRLIDIE